MNSLAANHTPAIRRRWKRRSLSIASVIGRKYGIRANPFFHPKLHNKRSTVSATVFPVSFLRQLEKSELSARKLAAWLWQSRFKNVSGYSGAGFEDWLLHLCKCEFEFASACLKYCKEELTKWDTALSDKSNKSTHIDSSNLLGGRKLRAELLHVLRYVNKPKAAPKSSKKNVEEFFHPFEEEEEEEMSWKGREFQKIQSLDFLKDKLARERRSRKRMETLNKNLLLKLDEANLSAKQFTKKFEEEKRGREVMEEVCNELAMQILEDKAKLEELQKKLLEIREEAEEERIILKMSALWREEQVQMKVEDAKHVLEDGYNQMMQLIGNLESFLKARGAELGIMDESKAESVNTGVQDNESCIDTIITASMDSKQKSIVVSGCEGGGLGQTNCRSDAMNPHVTRGMRGFVEWSPVNLKLNFMPITLEARVRKQKSLLKHMLKPKA